MYVYEYKRKKLTTVATSFVVAWAADFLLRVVLYINFGDEFYISSANRILAALSGVFAGCAITLWVIRSKSSPTKIVDPEDHVE